MYNISAPTNTPLVTVSIFEDHKTVTILRWIWPPSTSGNITSIKTVLSVCLSTLDTPLIPHRDLFINPFMLLTLTNSPYSHPLHTHSLSLTLSTGLSIFRQQSQGYPYYTYYVKATYPSIHMHLITNPFISFHIQFHSNSTDIHHTQKYIVMQLHIVTENKHWSISQPKQ